ncbi:PDDEXK family nuclease [Streptomyces calvus]|uniref:hypothetical protein n=1 Tax=Streptomyces calvus TaxID=67282 RepID=UPI0035710162
MDPPLRTRSWPELALPGALHVLGLRYRVNLPIPGMSQRRADVSFTRRRTAVFVAKAFWHACQKHLRAPKHNAEWWSQMLRATPSETRKPMHISCPWVGCRCASGSTKAWMAPLAK